MRRCRRRVIACTRSWPTGCHPLHRCNECKTEYFLVLDGIAGVLIGSLLPPRPGSSRLARTWLGTGAVAVAALLRRDDGAACTAHGNPVQPLKQSIQRLESGYSCRSRGSE